MSRMTKERRADLEKLADEDPHMCLLRELLNEIDALQQESALLLQEQVKLLREAAEDARKELEAQAAYFGSHLDPENNLFRILRTLEATLEATKEGA